MKADDILSTIKTLYSLRRTLCIEGAPGGGKTTLVQQAAKELGVQYIEKHMPTMLVEDFGIPMPSKTDDGARTTSYYIPDWFPTDPDSKGILCFDDRNQAGADLQKVLANICQARNLHGIPLPEGWMVVSTGNRQSDRAGANRVLSHLRNRETVLEFDTDTETWTKWAVRNGVHESVVAFMGWKPSLLHKFDPAQEANPTPRSWTEGVSPLIGVIAPHVEYECFKGAVGEGAAAEFLGFLRIYRNLPDLDKVFTDPLNAQVPDESNVLYAMAGAIAAKVTPQNFGAVVQYLARLPGEFNVLCVQMAYNRDTSIVRTKEMAAWAKDHGSILFGGPAPE